MDDAVDEVPSIAKALRKRNVIVKFLDDNDTNLALFEKRRLAGKENAKKKAPQKSAAPTTSRRTSLCSVNSDSDYHDHLMKINEEVIPDIFTEKINRPLGLLQEDSEVDHVGFRTPRKRKSMVLKAQESAQMYSSPKGCKTKTPSKTPRGKCLEKTECTPSRRVSFGQVIGATPSKGDGTPTKGVLKRRESLAGTPKARSSLLQDPTYEKQPTASVTVDKTPGRLRARTRGMIEKSVAQLEDPSSDEYKPSDESSESSSDTSEDDSESEGSVELDCKAKPFKIVSQTHSNSSKFSHKNAKEDKDYGILTDAYFETQSAKPITSNNTLSRLKTPRLEQDILQKLLKDVDTPHHEPIAQLSNYYHSHAEQWLFSLWEGYSILLYGLGSKRHILQTFQQETLCNCNVVQVNGFFPGVTVKNVLEEILTKILELKDVPSNLLECLDLIETIQSKPCTEPIYLLVHNLDGATFRNDKTQAVLSYLAQLPKIHLIASIDHLNAPLLWDQAKLRRYNFIWWDVSTFVAYEAETSFESSMLIQQTGALALSSLNSVFKSLIPNAKKVFLLIAKNQLKNAKNQNYLGISFQDLYWKCRADFLASSDRVLRAQLTEFLDHHLLKARRGRDGVENLLVPIENGVLSQFLESQEVED